MINEINKVRMAFDGHEIKPSDDGYIVVKDGVTLRGQDAQREIVRDMLLRETADREERFGSYESALVFSAAGLDHKVTNRLVLEEGIDPQKDPGKIEDFIEAFLDGMDLLTPRHT